MKLIYVKRLNHAQNIMLDLCFRHRCILLPLSSEVDGTSVGIIPEITPHLFSLVPHYEVKFVALPWARAQLSVEKGAADGFVTYPSGKRKQYALFTKGVANKIDFGYLIYPKDHERRIELEEAQSFQDLKSFKAVIQSGVGWEQDNIPDYIKRVPANNLDTMTHLLFFRRQGDFFIMPPSQAMFYAKKFGYQNNVAYRRAAFINDAEIPLV